MESISTLRLNSPIFPTISSHLVSQPMRLSNPDAMRSIEKEVSV